MSQERQGRKFDQAFLLLDEQFDEYDFISRDIKCYVVSSSNPNDTVGKCDLQIPLLVVGTACHLPNLVPFHPRYSSGTVQKLELLVK